MEHKLIATHHLVDSDTGTIFLWTEKEPLSLFVYRGMPEDGTGEKPIGVLPLSPAALNEINNLISPLVMSNVAQSYLDGELIR